MKNGSNVVSNKVSVLRRCRLWGEKIWMQNMKARKKERLEREIMELEIQQGDILEFHKDAVEVWKNLQEAMGTLPPDAKQELMSSPKYNELQKIVEGIMKNMKEESMRGESMKVGDA